MIYFEFLVAFLCSWRLTDLFLHDQIFQWLRNLRADKFNPVRCIFCVSVWAGIVAALTMVYFPLLNLPLAFSQLRLIVEVALNWSKVVRMLTDMARGLIVFRAGPSGPQMEAINVNPEQAHNAIRLYMDKYEAEREKHAK